MRKRRDVRNAYDMLYLVTTGINKVKPDLKRVSRMDFEKLYQLSYEQNLTHLVYTAIASAFDDASFLEDPVMKKWKEESNKAIRKTILFDVERKQLLDYCEKTGIWYLPLKGIVLKDLYPELGMRQMSDNDILFDPDYQEDIYKWFVGRGYDVKSYQKEAHDNYCKKPVYNFEMHISLFSEEYNQVWSDYYGNIKQRLCKNDGNSYGYHFKDEDFYVYFMAHMYKHFKGRGTGIRSLLDCYIYNKVKGSQLNWEYIHQELSNLGIMEYEENTRKLANVVFTKAKTCTIESFSDEEKLLLGYYLFSGTYGNKEQWLKNRLKETNVSEKEVSVLTKIKYAIRRVIPDKEYMEQWCELYMPNLLKYRWIMPLTPIIRIISVGLLRFGEYINEIKILWKI